MSCCQYDANECEKVRDELSAARNRIRELKAALFNARSQIEYLHQRFTETGSGNAAIARISAVLNQQEAG